MPIMLLTNEAKTLLPSVRSLLAMVEHLEQNINEINGLESGRLTIATFSSISIHWLPKIIYVFQQIYPNINIKLMEGGTDDIVNWIESDIADFGFLSHRQTKALDWISLYDDPLVAVVPLDYPTPENHAFPISDFENQYFIISAIGTDYDVHHALSSSHITPNIRFTAKDDHTIISMIANKPGISILPELIVHGFESQVATYPLNPYYSRTLGVAMKSRETISPAAKKFLKLAADMVSDLV